MVFFLHFKGTPRSFLLRGHANILQTIGEIFEVEQSISVIIVFAVYNNYYVPFLLR